MFTYQIEYKAKITEPWNKVTPTYKNFRVKGLVILIHNMKEIWKYINRVSRYKAKSLNSELRSHWPRTTLGSKVLSYTNIHITVKEICSYTNWVPRYKEKSLNREIRSQWPISILGSKGWSYSVIIWKKNENILIECQYIRPNHWTMESRSTQPYCHDTQVSVTKLKDEWPTIFLSCFYLEINRKIFQEVLDFILTSSPSSLPPPPWLQPRGPMSWNPKCIKYECFMISCCQDIDTL